MPFLDVGLLSQKCAHVESGLCLLPAEPGRDRTGAAHKATLAAGCTLGGSNMRDASRNVVVPTRCKRADRAGGFAGACVTAGAGAVCRWGQIKLLGQGQRCAEADEQSSLFVDEQPDGRRPAFPAPIRPSQEGRIGRAVIGKNRFGVQRCGYRCRHAFGPTIQWMPLTVPVFRRRSEHLPEMRLVGTE